MQPTVDPGQDLESFLRPIRDRLGTVILAIIVVVASTVLVAKLQRPRYRATADVLIQPSSSPTLFNNSVVQTADPTRDDATQVQVVLSSGVKGQVIQQLGRAPHVSVAPVGQTDVIAISATDTQPTDAALVANTYANTYINFRQSQTVQTLVAEASQLAARIDDLQNQINAVGAPSPTGDNTERDDLLGQQSALKQQLEQLQVETNLNSGAAQLVTVASTPTSPASPRVARDAIIALVVGLLLGIGAALFLDYIDDSIETPDDIERVLPGCPNLGSITRVPTWKTRDEAVVISVAEPTSATAEDYRSLRTAVQFTSLDHPLQTIQVTSAEAGEGKTTTLANLGVALAQVGHQVILACCDLRRPRLHEFFGLDNSIGFTSVVLGNLSVAEALQDVPNVPGLRILASGPLPPNPAELLSSRRGADVIASLQMQADMILLDSPPVLPITDAAVLSARVDGTLFVVAAKYTTRKHLARAYDILQQVDAPVLGTVLNGVIHDRRGNRYGYRYGYRYRYAHGYGYGQPHKEARPNGRLRSLLRRSPNSPHPTIDA